MLDSWTDDMEVEKHASAVSEIGFQIVGGRNQSEKLCYGRILKRAVKNGCVREGYHKARNGNNTFENFCSNNAKASGTQSIISCNADESKSKGDNGKHLFDEERNNKAEDVTLGLTTNGLNGKRLSNGNDINKSSSLFDGDDNEKEISEKHEYIDSGVEESDVIRKHSWHSSIISNCKAKNIQLESSNKLMCKGVNCQPCLNGHFCNNKEAFITENGNETSHSKNFFSGGKCQRNSNVQDALNEICHCKLCLDVERCKVVNGINHMSYIGSFNESEAFQCGNEIAGNDSVKLKIRCNASCRNDVIKRKFTQKDMNSNENGITANDASRVRLKESSLNSDCNDVTMNPSGVWQMSNVFNSMNADHPANIEKDCKSDNGDSDERMAFENGDDDILETFNDAAFDEIRRSKRFTRQNLITYNEERSVKKLQNYEEMEPFVNKIESCSVSSTTNPNKNAPSKASDTDKYRNGANLETYCLCNWASCDAKLSDAMELKTHVKEVHVKTMAASDLFFCFWKGCKVYNKPSTSYNWLVKHVNTHVGIRPFQCVIEPCSLSFASHGALIRHVQSHFNERSKYYKKPKAPAKDVSASPARTEETFSGSESTSSKESKRRKPKIFMKRRRNPNSGFVTDDLDRDAMVYVKKKLFHLESGRSLQITGLRSSMIQPLGKRISDDGTSQYLISFYPNERNDRQTKWYNEKDVLHNGVCQLPLRHLPTELQQHMFTGLFGTAKQRRGRKIRHKVFA